MQAVFDFATQRVSKMVTSNLDKLFHVQQPSVATQNKDINRAYGYLLRAMALENDLQLVVSQCID